MSIQKCAKLVPWNAGLALMGLVALTTPPGSAAPTGTKFYKFSVSPSGASSPVTSGTHIHGVDHEHPETVLLELQLCRCDGPESIHEHFGGHQQRQHQWR
jgi:hypothetical protein